MTDTPHQCTCDAWEANAEVWDARMGDDGNDFFKMICSPASGKTLLARPARYLARDEHELP